MKKLIVIGGPTASGKTGLAIELAKHYNTEIINADSRQFYRNMNIGTAKPTQNELAAVKHHFIDTLDPKQDYNIGKYEIDALQLIEELFKTNDHLILVGGSGLYIQAVCEGIDELPETDAAIRTKWKTIFEEKGISFLADELKNKDPDYYKLVDIKNKHRLIRALEIIEQTGKTFSSFRKAVKKIRSFQTIKFSLDIEREILYKRINQRVDRMIIEGLVEEVESLLPFRNYNALQTVGYSEIFSFLDGIEKLEDAIELIKKHSRNYAKRQLTWFRRDKEFNWLKPDNVNEFIEIIEST